MSAVSCIIVVIYKNDSLNLTILLTLNCMCMCVCGECKLRLCLEEYHILRCYAAFSFGFCFGPMWLPATNIIKKYLILIAMDLHKILIATVPIYIMFLHFQPIDLLRKM